MRINTNLNAMIATNQMSKNTALAGSSMEKLSTGLRITKAGDDAAGLAVSEKMRAQIRGMEQAERNVQDGISMVQTMRELGIQAGNDTLSPEDRSKIKGELTQLKDEMTKIADETKFNGKALLNTLGTFKIQAGANKETRDVVTADLSSIAKGISISTLSTASNAQSLV